MAVDLADRISAAPRSSFSGPLSSTRTQVRPAEGRGCSHPWRSVQLARELSRSLPLLDTRLCRSRVHAIRRATSPRPDRIPPPRPLSVRRQLDLSPRSRRRRDARASRSPVVTARGRRPSTHPAHRRARPPVRLPGNPQRLRDWGRHRPRGTQRQSPERTPRLRAREHLGNLGRRAERHPLGPTGDRPACRVTITAIPTTDVGGASCRQWAAHPTFRVVDDLGSDPARLRLRRSATTRGSGRGTA